MPKDKVIAAGHGVVVFYRKRRFPNPSRFTMRENGYLSTIDESHARILVRELNGEWPEEPHPIDYEYDWPA